MPILRLKEIDKMSSDEREKKLSELRAELSRLRTMISAGGAVENPTRVSQIRKTIAQILTIDNEYKLGIRSNESGKQEEKSKNKKKKEKRTK